MKWVEIISLRSSSNVDTRFVDELLKEVSASDAPANAPKHLMEIRIYHHSVVETDLSIHIYWQSEPGTQDKSPLGLRLSSALRNLGLLNHSVWVETAARECAARNQESSTTCDLRQRIGGRESEFSPGSDLKGQPQGMNSVSALERHVKNL